jgi:hypothetical protein
MPDDTNTQPSQNVTLRPHQQEFVSRVLSSQPPARFLLSSPPGAGKAAALAAVAGALKAKRGGLRCLAIVPAPLAAKRNQIPQRQFDLLKEDEGPRHPVEVSEHIAGCRYGLKAMWRVHKERVVSLQEAQDGMDAVLNGYFGQLLHQFTNLHFLKQALHLDSGRQRQILSQRPKRENAQNFAILHHRKLGEALL